MKKLIETLRQLWCRAGSLFISKLCVKWSGFGDWLDMEKQQLRMAHVSLEIRLLWNIFFNLLWNFSPWKVFFNIPMTFRRKTTFWMTVLFVCSIRGIYVKINYLFLIPCLYSFLWTSPILMPKRNGVLGFHII